MPKKRTSDRQPVVDAQALGRRQKTKAATNAALEKHSQRRKQLSIVKLFGTIEYDARYDYKRERRRRAK